MISFASGNSLISQLAAQDKTGTDSASASAASGLNAAAKARLATTSQAALKAAGATHTAASAGLALDKQQAALGTSLRAAMDKAGVKLAGAVDFSVSSDGKVEVKGTEADKAATTAFLKADTSSPSFATRIASQAKDALKLSASIQQNAAITQAARYGGKSGGVMSLYTSLMQQSGTSAAVFSLSGTASSLTYPGSLAAKA